MFHNVLGTYGTYEERRSTNEEKRKGRERKKKGKSRKEKGWWRSISLLQDSSPP